MLTVAAVATSGSLYFSLGMGLYPCRLCWYQRILMYPLVLFLAVSLYEERPVHKVALPMAAGGLLIAAYHSVLQLTPSLSCGTLACSHVQFELFGLLTIPNLSLIAFTLLAALVLVSARVNGWART